MVLGRAVVGVGGRIVFGLTLHMATTLMGRIGITMCRGAAEVAGEAADVGRARTAARATRADRLDSTPGAPRFIT